MAQQAFWKDEDVLLFEDNVRKIFEREFVPQESKWRDAHITDKEIWRKAGSMGLLCAAIPEQYGGAGGSFAHEAVIAAEQAYTLVNSFSISVHSGIVAHYILNYGSEEQRLKWLPKMASGEYVAAIAMSEPGAGSDLKGVRTSAVRDQDSYVINGAKTFITNGQHADLICIVTKTNPELGARGVSLIVVETENLSGFRRGRLLRKIGQHGQDTIELFFDNVRVPASNLLGEQEGQGFVQLMQQLPRERLLIAINSLWTMRRAIDETVRYVSDRKVFGKPLIDMQNTRFKLAECEAVAAVGQAFVDQCIAEQLRGELTVANAAKAKLWISEQSCKVIDECLQLHGGYGYMEEYPIARMFVDSRVQRIYGGANEIMKELIARSLVA